MAEKVVSKLRGNMWRLIILAVAGSLIYGPVSYTHLTLPTT